LCPSCFDAARKQFTKSRIHEFANYPNILVVGPDDHPADERGELLYARGSRIVPRDKAVDSARD
jgi:hypothetical protein